MSFYFTLKSGDKEFEIGRNMPGLWETFECFRVNPSENDVVNGKVDTPFEGWTIPTEALAKLYTGLSVIVALYPRTHFMMPEYDDCREGIGYWRLLSASDFEEDIVDPRFTVEALNADNEIRAKVYAAYSYYISNGLGYSSPGDYNGNLSVYFWNFITEMQKFIHEALHNSFNGIPTRFYN